MQRTETAAAPRKPARLLRNGCPIGHIQGLLGHERLETTCRYYLGALDNKELKKLTNDFLNGSSFTTGGEPTMPFNSKPVDERMSFATLITV